MKAELKSLIVLAKDLVDYKQRVEGSGGYDRTVADEIVRLAEQTAEELSVRKSVTAFAIEDIVGVSCYTHDGEAHVVIDRDAKRATVTLIKRGDGQQPIPVIKPTEIIMRCDLTSDEALGIATIEQR